MMPGLAAPQLRLVFAGQLRLLFTVALMATGLTGIAGCQHLPGQHQHLADIAHPSPQSLGQTIGLLQRIDIRYHSDTHTGNSVDSGDKNIALRLLLQTEIEADKLTMVGSTANGIVLFTLVETLGKITVNRSAGLPKTISPRAILFGLQLGCWPRTALSSFNAAGYRVEQLASGTQLLNDDRLLLHSKASDIARWKNMQIDIHYYPSGIGARQQLMHIQTLDVYNPDEAATLTTSMKIADNVHQLLFAQDAQRESL